MHTTAKGDVTSRRPLAQGHGGLGTTAASTNGASGFAIFSDENGSAASSTQVPRSGPTWSELPAERITTKENRAEPGKWNTGGLGGKRTHIAAPVEAFPVFADADSSDAGAHAPSGGCLGVWGLRGN